MWQLHPSPPRADHEIQHVLIIQQARDVPGCQLTYAVARHHQRARYLALNTAQASMAWVQHRICPTLFVWSASLVSCAAHQFPRILSAQNESPALEHWVGFRRIGQQIEHVRTLVALPRAKESYPTHERVSKASRKSVTPTSRRSRPGLGGGR